MIYYNYFHYRSKRRKNIFIVIAIGIVFLLIFDSPLHKSFLCCDDEFQGDEDDLDSK